MFHGCQWDMEDLMRNWDCKTGQNYPTGDLIIVVIPEQNEDMKNKRQHKLKSKCDVILDDLEFCADVIWLLVREMCIDKKVDTDCYILGSWRWPKKNRNQKLRNIKRLPIDCP